MKRFCGAVLLSLLSAVDVMLMLIAWLTAAVPSRTNSVIELQPMTDGVSALPPGNVITAKWLSWAHTIHIL